MTRVTRRNFLASAVVTYLHAESPPIIDVKRFRTPYKHGKLVLAAADDPGAFDSRTVDCPVVFHHDGQFCMTYVAWDGVGYQTGLA